MRSYSLIQTSLKVTQVILRLLRLLIQKKKVIIEPQPYYVRGGNYADNEDGPVFCNLCVHRGTIKTNYDSLTGTSYIDFYYRINHGVVEIWISPKKQFPNIISILVMRNSFNHWTVGQLEMSRELPAGLVGF